MKLAIFSDTHGSTGGMVNAIRRVSPDILVHLGDYIRDTEKISAEFSQLPLYSVSGNCDYTSVYPDTMDFMAGSVKVFATHGHRYGVKHGLNSLLNAAHFSGVSLVLYGHTHVAHFDTVAEMNIVNPGSAGTGSAPTFAVVEISDTGGIVCSLRNI